MRCNPKVSGRDFTQLEDLYITSLLFPSPAITEATWAWLGLIWEHSIFSTRHQRFYQSSRGRSKHQWPLARFRSLKMLVVDIC